MVGKSSEAALATDSKPRDNAQGRGGDARGGRGGRGGGVRAIATAEVISIISSIGLHSPPCSISSGGLHRPSRSIISISSSSGLHSPPRNISRSSRRNISSSCRSINSSSSGVLNSSGRQDTLVGGEHRVFVSVAASPNTYMQSFEQYLPHRLKRTPSASVHCPSKRPTCNLLYESSWRLCVFLEITTTDSRCPHRRFRIYCARPPPTRLKAEYVGNIDVVFHGRNDEPITLCDVSYIQGLR